MVQITKRARLIVNMSAKWLHTLIIGVRLYYYLSPVIRYRQALPLLYQHFNSVSNCAFVVSRLFSLRPKQRWFSSSS